VSETMQRVRLLQDQATCKIKRKFFKHKEMTQCLIHTGKDRRGKQFSVKTGTMQCCY